MATVPARYGPEFFAAIEGSSERAAQQILPLVFDLLEPTSVADVGCGPGVWLVEAERLGIRDSLGIDGYTPTESLRFDPERFLLHDLTAPLRLERGFDLVICLEVAEHVDPDADGVLIESLARLAPAVLFSAAVPSQSGQHHVNERWPAHWVELFARHELVPVDAIRPQIWSDATIPCWYRQNALLFCTRSVVEARPALRAAHEATRDQQLAVVHPELYSWIVRQRDELRAEASRVPGLRELLRLLPGAAARAARRRAAR